MTTYESLTYTQWEEKFKPVTNHLTKQPDSLIFETYGEDWEHLAGIDNKYIWTFGDSGGCSYISNGQHWVNRLHYHITEIPWEEDVSYDIIVSTDEDCECYDESRMEDNEEPGNPDCNECEGSGLITVYHD